MLDHQIDDLIVGQLALAQTELPVNLFLGPEELARRENHPSWTHMYWMMMVAQCGFALAYLL